MRNACSQTCHKSPHLPGSGAVIEGMGEVGRSVGQCGKWEEGGRKPPCKAFWCYTEALDSTATTGLLQNQVALLGASSFTQGKEMKGEGDDGSQHKLRIMWQPFQPSDSPGAAWTLGLVLYLQHFLQSLQSLQSAL